MTLYILDMNKNKQLFKTSAVYFVLSITAILVNNVYAIFGHGMRSAAMTWMFLYLLIGGTLFYLSIRFFFVKITKHKSYRVFFNLYNSGIAALTAGSLFKGIIEIAGSSCVHTKIFFIVGLVCILFSSIILILMIFESKWT